METPTVCMKYNTIYVLRFLGKQELLNPFRLLCDIESEIENK